jgi:hypothetical protein
MIPMDYEEEAHVIPRGVPPLSRTLKEQALSKFVNGTTALPPSTPELSEDNRHQDAQVEENELPKQTRPKVYKRSEENDDVLSSALGSAGTVTISNEYLSITFRSEAISVNESSLGFLMKTKNLKIEPKNGSEFTIKIGDATYPALYAGGFFTFPRSEYSLLSFMRILA